VFFDARTDKQNLLILNLTKHKLCKLIIGSNTCILEEMMNLPFQHYFINICIANLDRNSLGIFIKTIFGPKNWGTSFQMKGPVKCVNHQIFSIQFHPFHTVVARIESSNPQSR
jgi:hypothetical protein